jgi:hypothetical protein
MTVLPMLKLASKVCEVHPLGTSEVVQGDYFAAAAAGLSFRPDLFRVCLRGCQPIRHFTRRLVEYAAAGALSPFSPRRLRSG